MPVQTTGKLMACLNQGRDRTNGSKLESGKRDFVWRQVMEEKHKARVCADYRGDLAHKAIHVLDIPDEYKFMDPELVEIIWEQSEPLILGELEKT